MRSRKPGIPHARPATSGEQLGRGLRRGGEGRCSSRLVVVGDPDRDAARGGGAQRAGDEVARRAGQPDVVQGDVVGALCLTKKGGHLPRHVEIGLATRMERSDLDH